ncbi:MAG: ral secretion pathway protein [Betaproteobacteria bacterium]|nr:ral secretion pathway protein [Betaproteobacteria bacterium]
MSAVSIERPGVAQTAAVSLLTLLATVMLGLVLAYWTWMWLAPGATPLARVDDAAPRIESAYGLFGGSRTKSAAIAPTGLAIKLLGVAAASAGKRGYAVLQLEAKEILSVREGDAIAEGIRLAEVHADHVVLDRSGTRETLGWPDKPVPTREKTGRP